MEHDIQASLEDLSTVDYVAADPGIIARGKSKEDVGKALQSVGFSAEQLVSNMPASGVKEWPYIEKMILSVQYYLVAMVQLENWYCQVNARNHAVMSSRFFTERL